MRWDKKGEERGKNPVFFNLNPPLAISPKKPPPPPPPSSQSREFGEKKGGGKNLTEGMGVIEKA